MKYPVPKVINEEWGEGGWSAWCWDTVTFMVRSVLWISLAYFVLMVFAIVIAERISHISLQCQEQIKTVLTTETK